jgi:hypothetical protein
MRIISRGLVTLSALAVIAACGGGGDGESNLASISSKHVVQCVSKTPGFWCGGATAQQEALCQANGFASCEAACQAVYVYEDIPVGATCRATMCECFTGANATKDDPDPTNNPGGICQDFCDEGMTDMLVRAFAAWRLGNPSLAGFNCSDPIAVTACGGGGFPTCNLEEVEDLIQACDPNDDDLRAQKEAVKTCIDEILNTQGSTACVSFE